MKRLSGDESGQVHTMEGVIAGLMMVLVLTYIIGSITMLSPQTEKTTSVKLTIKAEDFLMVMGTVDQSSNMSSPLLRDISMWKNGTITPGFTYDQSDTYIGALNDSLFSMLPLNVFYNVYLSYYNDSTGRVDNVKLIYMGEPYGSAASASKTIVLNSGDITSASQKWWNMTTPKAVDVRLILWSL